MSDQLPDDIRTIIRNSVKETLVGLGFDAEYPREMQQDLSYLRKIRKGSEELSKKAKASLIAILVSSIAYILWEAFKRVMNDNA